METVRRFSRWALRTRWPAVPVALGVLLAAPSLLNGLHLDDYTIRSAVLESELAEGVRGNRWEPFTFFQGDPEQSRRLIDRGLAPWWMDPQCRAALWRPLTAATHIVDFHLWPELPWLMHLQSIAWYGLLICAVAGLYRRLMGRTLPAWTAALAAVLFALDDAHGFPTGFLANRNVLIAGVFGVLSLLAYDRWRRDGWRPGAFWAPLALAAGLLAKETAVCAGAYLLAYAVLLDRRPGRWLSLLPSVAVGAAWYAAYRALGFGLVGIDIYADPAHNPAGFVDHVFRFAPLLLLGQFSPVTCDVYAASSPALVQIHWWTAVAFLAVLVGLFVPLVVRGALARFWCLGMLLSLLPACIPFPMDRLLMFVGVGGMGLLAQLIVGLHQRADWLPRPAVWRGPARVLVYLLLAVHLVLGPLQFVVATSVPGVISRLMERLHDSFPKDRQLSGQRAVVVGGVWAATRNMIEVRHARGQPLPAGILQVGPPLRPARITRTDRSTLVVRPQGGYFPPWGWWPEGEPPPAVSLVYPLQLMDQVVRSRENALKLGDTVELSWVTIEITAMTEDGRPAEATFRFHRRLEDPSLRWLRLTGEGYVPFELPAIDETVELLRPFD